MHYLSRVDLRRLLETAHKANSHHALALNVSLWHATRVSEMLAIEARHVWDGMLTIKALKGGEESAQPIRIDPDPIFDCSGLIKLAATAPSPETRLFPWVRQWPDIFVRRYGKQAGIDPAKCHMHALRHSMAMLLWDETNGQIGLLQRHLRHKRASSSLVYLYEADQKKASAAVAGIRL